MEEQIVVTAIAVVFGISGTLLIQFLVRRRRDRHILEKLKEEIEDLLRDLEKASEGNPTSSNLMRLCETVATGFASEPRRFSAPRDRGTRSAVVDFLLEVQSIREQLRKQRDLLRKQIEHSADPPKDVFDLDKDNYRGIIRRWRELLERL